MKWFNNMKIMTKLLSSFVIMAVITGIVGYIGIRNIKTIDDADTMLYEKMTVPISQLAIIAIAFGK